MHIIDEKLQQLECPVSLFVPIANIIGRTRLTQYLKGDAQLDQHLVAQLIVVLDEMAELKRAAFIAPNWQDAENVRQQLAQRRAFKQAAEYDSDAVRELLLGGGE